MQRWLSAAAVIVSLIFVYPLFLQAQTAVLRQARWAERRVLAPGLWAAPWAYFVATTWSELKRSNKARKLLG